MFQNLALSLWKVGVLHWSDDVLTNQATEIIFRLKELNRGVFGKVYMQKEKRT
jgi:hypothetical protein